MDKNLSAIVRLETAGTYNLIANPGMFPKGNEVCRIICNSSSGAFTINVPAIKEFGGALDVRLVVEDEDDAAATSNITINVDSTNSINNGSSLVMDQDGEKVEILIASKTEFAALTYSGVGAGNVLYAFKKTMTSGEILAGNTTPKTLVAAPGSGKIIQLNRAFVTMNFLTAAYATNTTLQIITDTATVAQAEAAAILAETATISKNFGAPSASIGVGGEVIANKALLAKVKTGDPVTGAGNLVIYGTYFIRKA